MAVAREWLILEQPALRDWLVLDAQPCVRCVELEAEALRLSDAILLCLRDELSQRDGYSTHLSDENLGLQIKLAGRGRPRKQGKVDPRTERRRRAKARAKVRANGIGATTWEDMLLALKPKRHTEG